MIRPNAEGRVFGTTYPADRAPAGSVPLGDDPPLSLREYVASLLTGVALRVLRVRPGDVIVIRGERPDAERVASIVRAIHKGNDGDPVAVFLPSDCRVHIERAADQRRRSRRVSRDGHLRIRQGRTAPPGRLYRGPGRARSPVGSMRIAISRASSAQDPTGPQPFGPLRPDRPRLRPFCDDWHDVCGRGRMPRHV